MNTQIYKELVQRISYILLLLRDKETMDAKNEIRRLINDLLDMIEVDNEYTNL